jgi:hypothetical protein
MRKYCLQINDTQREKTPSTSGDQLLLAYDNNFDPKALKII